MELIIGLFLCSFLAGLGTTWLIRRWVIRREIQETQIEANEILSEAESISQEIQRETQGRCEEFAHQAQDKFEKEIRKIEDLNSRLDSQVRERESRLQKSLNLREDVFQRKSSGFGNQKVLVAQRQQKFDQLKTERDRIFQDYRRLLSEHSSVSPETLTEELRTSLIQTEQRRAAQMADLIESEARTEAEKSARYFLNVALSRFARPYCEERGIGLVYFPNADSRQRVVGENRANLNALERICGVDISINEEFNSASCLGFDPVRRELARATMEKLIHERSVNEKRIEEIVAKTKRDLFKVIRQDGNKIAKELGMKDFHPEIINMLGALRYRYSFSQNQHFHCAEVGWLCGLLSSEIGNNQSLGRRAGLLHDIGKSMDHSMEGGHAVIGADFIQKNGESQEIVHAVRAHHFDEQPQTDLAYLVIAADAVSGARPGARRSTVDSYNQKMADLQNIGNSFPGVTNTYILSAGREVRVVVDSGRVDDFTALDLSKKIAQKIEEECSYPGQIRVTVVRESQAVEYAR
ncbi:MAG: DUF3552 domain-containing protein [Bdellovibrionales bacterium]|nr:DUF3552 domain-containing protein [Bdellovibrionales bacterium]